MLGTPIEVKKFYQFKRKAKEEKVEEIIPPVDPATIKNEVEGLAEEHLLFKSRNFVVYCAPSAKMPNILNEIGRLTRDYLSRSRRGNEP